MVGLSGQKMLQPIEAKAPSRRIISLSATVLKIPGQFFTGTRIDN
jgi:hypothetical protein